MEKEKVERKIKNAIKDFEERDHDLLEININERSVTHKLAEYLQVEFEDWNVDCEYNRKEFSAKELELPVKDTKSDDLKATTVYPDIIVHKRGKQDNLLVVEAKKIHCSDSDKEYDIKKLKAFKEQLNYKFAVFLVVGSDKFEEPEFIE